MSQANLIHSIRQHAHPLHNADTDYDALVDSIADARFVLIGEATHGTHEFYRDRALLTRRLIEEKGFSAVAVEADWPDTYRINRYVRNIGDDQTAMESLADFARFPTWMWRNADVLDFVGYLRDHNDSLPPRRSKVGFYGLDLYSLHRSLEAVLTYLQGHHPHLLDAARQRYSCFESFGPDPQSYGLSTGLGSEASCEDEVVAQLQDLLQHRAQLTQHDGPLAEDEFFFAEQNARLIKNAEEYYRQMYRGRKNTWNLRDTHMADTLDALANHLDKQLGPNQSKIVVWAHNSHLGDARATQMGQSGELNLGQLCRQRHPHDTFNIGFSTFHGTVTAASNWDSPAQRKSIRPALPDSYERLLHESELDNFYLLLRPSRTNSTLLDDLRQERLQRAIGVIYLPETERMSHYFTASLPDQFDAIIHYDHTRALEPLERTPKWTRGDLPETYPAGV